MDLGGVFSGFFTPVLNFIFIFFKLLISLAVCSVFVFLLTFLFSCRVNFLHYTPASHRKLKRARFKFLYHDLFRWLIVDRIERRRHAGEFREYGFTFFVGRQGAGKTISMVDYLCRMRRKYPLCIIVTNFKCSVADYTMRDWHGLLHVRNGTDGVIFAIDEISSEYSAASWKDIPETLLSEISQQRKQRIKIVATAQFFGRVAKPLREQANTVVSCRTSLSRLTSTKVYDALDYIAVIDNPQLAGKKIRPLSKHKFVQSDSLRHSYDTYEKVERMKKIEFIPRGERGSS